MDKRPLLLKLFLILFVLGLGALYQTVPKNDDIIHVSMKDNQGVEIGTVQLSETKAGTLLSLEIGGLKENGEHAIHIHETGDCSPMETFKNAGGHFNPTNHSHGMKHPEGQHAGDMPNLQPNAKGEISVQILNTNVTTHDENKAERSSLFDEDGSAIIIHAGADDHMSQPSGAAGARIACGVIIK